MITKKQLLDFGYKIFGKEDNDPYYNIILSSRTLGTYSLPGNFVDEDNNFNGELEEGIFKIYSIGDFDNIQDIKDLFRLAKFKINGDIMNRV